MRFIFTLILTFLSFVVTAKSTLSVDQERFEKKCLHSGYECMYQLVYITSKSTYHAKTIRYLSIDNPHDYNELLEDVRLRKLSAYSEVNNDKAPIKWIVLGGGESDEKTKQVNRIVYPFLARIIWNQNSVIPSSTFMDISEDFKFHPKEMRRIVVEPSSSVTIYADWVNDNIHYYRRTHRPTQVSSGTIFIDINGWTNNYDGSYYEITPIPYWKSLARQYMQDSSMLENGSDRLPIFSGSSNQIVQQSVDWMAAHLESNDKIAYILNVGGSDCKGLDFIFRQILKRSGIKSHPSAISSAGMPPKSFSLTDPNWADHIITYVPNLKSYVDIITAMNQPRDWRDSASRYTGSVTLDMQTGRFAIVNVIRHL